MRDRILEIVVFLMDYMRDSQGQLGDSDDFSSTLKTMGYSDNEISSAFYWLMNRFGSAPEHLFSNFPKLHHSSRILTASERVLLTTDAYGYLLKLQNLSLVDDEQFEAILERVSAFGSDPVGSEHIKLIASSVVFTDFDEFETLDSLETGGDTAFVN